MAKYHQVDDAVYEWLVKIWSINKRWKSIPISKAIIHSRAKLEEKSVGLLISMHLMDGLEIGPKEKLLGKVYIFVVKLNT